LPRIDWGIAFDAAGEIEENGTKDESDYAM
jgi:hypothetical protein